LRCALCIVQFDGTFNVKSESVEVNSIEAAGVATGPIVCAGFGALTGPVVAPRIGVGVHVGGKGTVGSSVAVGVGGAIGGRQAAISISVNNTIKRRMTPR
jgi:hypothetical protein